MIIVSSTACPLQTRVAFTRAQGRYSLFAIVDRTQVDADFRYFDGVSKRWHGPGHVADFAVNNLAAAWSGEARGSWLERPRPAYRQQ
jgi:hypothetical protein